MNKSFPLSVACSYARADEALLRDVQNALAPLVRSGILKGLWCDRKILPGAEWGNVIRDEINSADIILLLVSQDFLASDYCMEVEVKQALTRRDSDGAAVIPIILRDCYWRNEAFAHAKLGDVQVLPKGGKPIKSPQKDARLVEVVEGIQAFANSLVEAASKPDFTVMQIEKVLTFRDAFAKRATAERRVLLRADREGVDEFWFRNLSCDGQIESKTIDDEPPDDIKILTAVMQLRKRFPVPLHLGDLQWVHLCCDEIDAFKPTDALEFINAIDDETGALRVTINFHPDRPCISAEAFISLVGRTVERLPGLPKLSNDKCRAEMEVNKPKLGYEYVVRWTW